VLPDRATRTFQAFAQTYAFGKITAAWKETVKKASKVFQFMQFFPVFAPVAQPDRATDF
jgi:hypothetical protein